MALPPRPVPPMADWTNPPALPMVTPDPNSLGGPVPSLGRVLQGPPPPVGTLGPDATMQNTPPVVPDPAGAANPPGGVAPVAPIPPPALSAPQSPQNSGATPESNSSDSPQDVQPDPAQTREPTGAPSKAPPEGKVAPPGDNTRGLAQALSGLGAIKPPIPQHISSPAAPRPVGIHHQSQIPGQANAMLAAVAKVVQDRHTLGQALRGHQFA